MSQSTHLAGKVVRTSLPLLDPPTAPDAPVLKRIRLPQGNLAQIHDSEEGIRYIAMIDLVPGCVRGNHYHERKHELIYVISGAVELTVEDLETRVREQLVLETGDLVELPVRVAHALRTVRAGSAVEYSPVRVNREDVYRYPLV